MTVYGDHSARSVSSIVLVLREENFGNKNKNLYLTSCVNENRPIPTY